MWASAMWAHVGLEPAAVLAQNNKGQPQPRKGRVDQSFGAVQGSGQELLCFIHSDPS
jgi:hypothetical protein